MILVMNYLSIAFVILAILQVWKTKIDFRTYKALMDADFRKAAKPMREILLLDVIAILAWSATAILTYLKK